MASSILIHGIAMLSYAISRYVPGARTHTPRSRRGLHCNSNCNGHCNCNYNRRATIFCAFVRFNRDTSRARRDPRSSFRIRCTTGKGDRCMALSDNGGRLCLCLSLSSLSSSSATQSSGMYCSCPSVCNRTLMRRCPNCLGWRSTTVASCRSSGSLSLSLLELRVPPSLPSLPRCRCAWDLHRMWLPTRTLSGSPLHRKNRG
mmetsp:Transcript_11324/g.22375  ORF Transcript_11324/g.22375 Transcript_11324/m.22375 type:complete len:202 (-) Transcript_11324:755-1360(-)